MLLGEANTRIYIIYLLGSWKLELGSSKIFKVVEKARLVENEGCVIRVSGLS